MRYRIVCQTKIFNSHNLYGLGSHTTKKYIVQKKGWLWGWNNIGHYTGITSSSLSDTFDTIESAKAYITKQLVEKSNEVIK